VAHLVRVDDGVTTLEERPQGRSDVHVVACTFQAVEIVDYQCTMNTLSQSMKLQQLPEADADVLLRFPADSES
jgi:hypothetical protein